MVTKTQLKLSPEYIHLSCGRGWKDSSVIDVFASEAWDPRRMQMVDMAAHVQFQLLKAETEEARAGWPARAASAVSSELD